MPGLQAGVYILFPNKSWYYAYVKPIIYDNFKIGYFQKQLLLNLK